MGIDIARLRAALPPAPSPVGLYARGVIDRGLGVLSGQFPHVGGQLYAMGRLGVEVTVDQGRAAARLAALNALAQIDVLLEHDWSRFHRLLRLDGVVASDPGFTGQPRVLDGASELFLQLLGTAGQHARTAIGAPVLPLNAPLELCVMFSCHDAESL